MLVIVLVRARARRCAQAVRWLAPGRRRCWSVALVVYRLLLAPEHAAPTAARSSLSAVRRTLSVKGFLSTTWQFYFPRLPFMDARIGPDYGYRQVFIESFFGRFASLEVAYPAGDLHADPGRLRCSASSGWSVGGRDALGRGARALGGDRRARRRSRSR